ncbi:hypothetical protein [Luteimicrobium sp. DT211]|uniref:hypothetical protein n=1 Tax=Luteimicrobium sp. DT211 TaxID=3393412 RepID=UPI003CF09308
MQPLDPYHPTIAEHVPDHDRARIIRQGLIGAWQRKYDAEPRYRYAIDYLSELTMRLADELAHQTVADIAGAVDVVVDAKTEPRVRAWINRLDAGRRVPPASEIFQRAQR